MQFSHALVAILSLSASQAIAAPVQVGSSSSSNGADLAARSANVADLTRSFDAMVQRRSLTAQEAQEGRHIFARYAHIRSDRERSLAVVRDLSKRGILDTLVSAIAQIVNELLGTASPAARRRQTGPVITYTNDLISSAVCLLQSLLGVSTTGCSAPAAAAARRDVSSGTHALDFSSSDAAQTSLADMLTMIGNMLSEKGEALGGNSSSNATSANTTLTEAAGSSSSNATSAALPKSTTKATGEKGQKGDQKKEKSSERRDLMLTRQETEGVQGLLTVLRNLVDAILNTLLPMSQRDESSSSNSTETSGKNCPPAGTPNDGMYRPGCPGYGRRDVGNAPQLSTRDTNLLQSLLPMLQMLLEELPQLLSGDSSTASQSVSSLLTGATSTPAAAAKGDDAATDASSTATASSSGKKAKATGTKDAPISAAKLSIDTRELLGADGFERRQAATGTTDGDVGDDNGGSSQSGNTGGANVSVLNNLLNGLLGGLLGTSNKEGQKSLADVGGSNNGTSQDGNQGGLNVSILDNLLNGLLGGLLGTSSKRAVGSGIMGGVLANSYVKRAAIGYATRSIISARADLEPVWAEVKKLGNDHFTRSIHDNGDLLMARDEVTPVWTSFRDMIDATYAEDKANHRRSLIPRVDTSAFSHASAQLIKQKVFGKRDADLKPLTNAATNFAKSQMQEWTDALNAKKH